MAGYSSAGAGAVMFVDAKIAQRKVMLFTKKWSRESEEIKELLNSYKLSGNHYEFCEIESRQDCGEIENYFQILCETDSRVVSEFMNLAVKVHMVHVAVAFRLMYTLDLCKFCTCTHYVYMYTHVQVFCCTIACLAFE